MEEPAAFAAVADSQRVRERERMQDLLRETAQQAQEARSLEASTATRAELEDMLGLIEKQFRAEQMARKRAEEDEAVAVGELARVREARLRLEDELRTRSSEAHHTDALRAALLADYAAVEETRASVDAELAAARAAAKSALAALSKAELDARCAEGAELAALEGAHAAVMAAISADSEAVRHELSLLERSVGAELARWRGQAESAASAVRGARRELMERLREVEATKGRMAGLVEKLYVGRERGLELRAAVDGHLERARRVRELGDARNAATAAAAAAAAAAARPVQQQQQQHGRSPSVDAGRGGAGGPGAAGVDA